MNRKLATGFVALAVGAIGGGVYGISSGSSSAPTSDRTCGILNATGTYGPGDTVQADQIPAHCR